MKALFKVRQDLAFWASAAGKFIPGELHEVSGGDTEMALFEAAFAAGSITDLAFEDGNPPDSVESDDVSFVKLTEAMGELGPDGRYTGPWMEGHLEQMGLEAEGGYIEIGGEE